MNLFRGYVPTKNKHCLKKFKDVPIPEISDVASLPEYAGVLAEDTILIDVDDKEQSDILMDIVEELQLDCMVMRTTRGRHFYFKNDGMVKSCSTNKNLAIGLKADIKVGMKNSYAILKFDGKVRPIEWDVEDGVEYQVIPKWLLPMKGEVDLFGMDEGDGRNEKLFSYILQLVEIGLDKEDVRKTLQIINKHIFAKPMSEEELETVMRDESFPKDSFMGRNGFLHDKFGDYLIREKHIVRIDGRLHIYKNGVYLPDEVCIEEAMIDYLKSIKYQMRLETMKYIRIKAPKRTMADARYIAFKNGIYDLSTDRLVGFDPDIVVTNLIPWEYKTDAYSTLADKTLDKISCKDDQVRSLLEECVGYCFYRRNEMSKAFILTGEKANGKSTFLDMVKSVLGSDNVTALDMSELDEQFATSSLTGKLANIGDDISDDFMKGKSVAIFKKIISGNTIKGEFKGQDAFMFTPYVKLLFSANTIPRTKDKTGAVLRRLVIIPFDARFTDSDPDYDPYIKYKLVEQDAMEYLVRLGVEGLRRLLGKNKFTDSKKVTDALNEYEMENNPIMMFLQDKEEKDILNQEAKDVYSQYRIFCISNGYSEMTYTSFVKQINRTLTCNIRLVRVGQERVRIFSRQV